MYPDPTNLPFNLAAPPNVRGPGGSTAANPPSGVGVGMRPAEPGGTSNETLTIENILLAEFNYASTTAYQAMEDRARMFDRYLLIIGGVFVTGIGAIKQLNDIGATSYTHPVALIILIAGGSIGTSFFFSLIGLRTAWQRSAACMNIVKEFYIRQFMRAGVAVNRAFLWRLQTIPAERFKTVTGTVCGTVAFLNTLCWGIGAFVLTQALLFNDSGSFIQLFPNPLLYIPPIAVALIMFTWHILHFRRAMKRGREDALRLGQDVLDGKATFQQGDEKWLPKPL